MSSSNIIGVGGSTTTRGRPTSRQFQNVSRAVFGNSALLYRILQHTHLRPAVQLVNHGSRSRSTNLSWDQMTNGQSSSSAASSSTTTSSSNNNNNNINNSNGHNHLVQFTIGKRYDDWYDVTSICNAGYINLLEDKIKNERHLTWDNRAIEAVCTHVNDTTVFNSVYERKRAMFLSPNLIRNAVYGGNLNIVKLLVEQTTPVKLTPRDALEAAVEVGKLDILKYLLLVQVHPTDERSLGDSLLASDCYPSNAGIYSLLCSKQIQSTVTYMDNYFNTKQYNKDIFRCAIPSAIGRIIKTKRTNNKYIKENNNNLNQDQQSKFNYILDYICDKGNSKQTIERRIQILSLLCPDIKLLDIRKETGAIAKELGIPKSNSRALDMLVYIEIIKSVDLGDMSEDDTEYVVSDVIKLGCVELIPYAIDMLYETSTPFDLTCKHGTMEQIQRALDHINGRKELLSPRGLRYLLARDDPGSDEMSEKVLEIIQSLYPSTFNHNNSNRKSKTVIPGSMRKLMVLYKLYGSFDLVAVGNLPLDVLQCIHQHQQQQQQQQGNNSEEEFFHQIDIERQIRYSILMDDLPMFQWINNQLPSFKCKADQLFEAVRYGRCIILDNYISTNNISGRGSGRPRGGGNTVGVGGVGRSNLNNRNHDYGQLFYWELGLHGDVGMYDKYYPSNGDIYEVVRGSIQANRKELVEHIISTHQGSRDQLIDRCITYAISFNNVDMLQVLNNQKQQNIKSTSSNNTNINNQGSKKRSISVSGGSDIIKYDTRSNVLEAITSGSVDALQWILEASISSKDKDKQILDRVSGIPQQEFMDSLLRGDCLEMFHYLCQIGYPFTSLGSIVKNNIIDLIDKMTPTIKKLTLPPPATAPPTKMKKQAATIKTKKEKEMIQKEVQKEIQKVVQKEEPKEEEQKEEDKDDDQKDIKEMNNIKPKQSKQPANNKKQKIEQPEKPPIIKQNVTRNQTKQLNQQQQNNQIKKENNDNLSSSSSLLQSHSPPLSSPLSSPTSSSSSSTTQPSTGAGGGRQRRVPLKVLMYEQQKE